MPLPPVTHMNPAKRIVRHVLFFTGYVALATIVLSTTKNFEAIGQVMNSGKKCSTSLERSQAIFRAILDDLPKHYTQVGGGGISEIKQTASDTFVVSIPQEERIDQISYKIEMSATCVIKIKSRVTSAISL
jgi:hypothetical protein